MSVSLTILRERGPMTLRDLTRETAIRMGHDQFYTDVDAVMRRLASDGEVRLQRHRPDNWVENVWAAALGEEHSP